MAPHLCQNCYNLVSNTQWDNKSCVHQDDFVLTPSGCVICTKFVRYLLSHSSSGAGPLPLCTMSYEYDPISPAMGNLSVIGQFPGTRDQAQVFLVMPDNGHQLRWAQRSLSDTLSQDTIKFLRTKLSECVDTHVDCHGDAVAGSSTYPTRLLNLNTHDRSKVILEDTGSGTNGSYFTLSHCWGGLQPLRLTQESERSLRDGIDVNLLPTTFQHAIEVCQQLNIPYLWIDSMCIFQDNLTDWEIQSAAMHQVYAFALCNIAATSAPDGSYGLCFDRDLDELQPFTVLAPRQFWLKADKEPAISYIFYPTHGYLSDIYHGCLNQRSWVLQESILSRRIMHFTTSGAYWECLTHLSNDIYPSGLPEALSGLQHTVTSKLRLLLLQMPKLGSDQAAPSWTAEIYKAWNWLCERYAECNITVSSDKLVALNGIAQEVALKTGDALLCGLWRQHLLGQLLWVQIDVVLAPVSSRLVNEWRAPSWSWAKHDIKIHHSTHLSCDNRCEKAVVEFLDVQAPFGQLKHASLTLCGRIVHATLTVDPAIAWQNSFTYTGTTEPLPTNMQFLFLDSPYRDHMFHAQVVCIAIYEDACKKGLHYYEKRKGRLGVLVLKQCCFEPVKYERVGVFLLKEEYCDMYTAHESQEEHSITII